MSEQQLSGENHRGGVETSSEKMAREFAILQKVLGALQLEVAELKKPVPQKALEAAQRSYQKKVEQLQKVQAKMVALNTKIETNKRKLEAKIGSSVNNSLQSAGNFIKNDVSKTVQDAKFIGAKIGQGITGAANIVDQGYQFTYQNTVKKPANFVENRMKRTGESLEQKAVEMKEIISELEDYNPDLFDLIKDRQFKNSQKLLSENNVPYDVDTLKKYAEYAFEDGIWSNQEKILIGALTLAETTEQDKKYLAKLQTDKPKILKNAQKAQISTENIAKGLNYIAKTDIRDIGQMAKNKLKNLFGKKKNNSQSPTN